MGEPGGGQAEGGEPKVCHYSSRRRQEGGRSVRDFFGVGCFFSGWYDAKFLICMAEIIKSSSNFLMLLNLRSKNN